MPLSLGNSQTFILCTGFATVAPLLLLNIGSIILDYESLVSTLCSLVFNTCENRAPLQV